MSQKSEILRHLKKGNSITQVEAFKLFSCFRLASRIEELRVENEITTNMVGTNKKKYASYVLVN